MNKVGCPKCKIRFKTSYAMWDSDGRVICPNVKCHVHFFPDSSESGTIEGGGNQDDKTIKPEKAK